MIPQTVWDYDEVGHTQEAKQEIIRILGATDAPVTPKPVALIRRIIQIASEPGDVVLDSFAGTGTTAHSVIAENATEESEQRRFVLVQNQHDTKEDVSKKRNLCATLTAERVRRVIRGYDYVKRGPKGKTAKAHEEGLGGSFTYVRVGEPLFSEYKDFGKNLPSFEDLARYVYYTETSREIDLKPIDAQTGFIGATPVAGGTAYYLLYSPNHKEDRELSTETLAAIAKRQKKAGELVVYCEKVWMHPEELRRFEREHNVRVRPMLVPSHLK